MKIVKPLLFSLALLLAGQLSAQDIHWTLFNFSPLTLNPSHTGDFYGSFRIGGIYRDQARSALQSNAYTTPSIHVDAPILMLGKRAWLGIGGMFYRDQVGVGSLTSTASMLSAAVHMPTNKKSTTVFSFGIQGGSISKKVNTDEFDFEDEAIIVNNEFVFEGISQQFAGTGGGGPNGGLQMGEIDRNHLDFSAGLLLRSQLNKQTGLQLGFAVRHIPNPKDIWIDKNDNLDRNEVRLPLRFNFHGGFDFAMGDKWSLSPGFLYSQMRSASNVQVQSMLGYRINPEKDVKLNFGLGYRLSDALEFLLGLDYKQFRVGASYDMTLSSLNEVNNTVGGFELAVSYIAIIFKSAEVPPVIFCPRF